VPRQETKVVSRKTMIPLHFGLKK